jgi:predicted metal-dependent hydrolase
MKVHDIEIKEIIKSKRETFSIKVEPDSTVSMRVPKFANKKLIEEVVAQKKTWIIDKQSELKQKQDEIPIRKFEEGETIPFLGNAITLSYYEGNQGIFLQDSQLNIPEIYEYRAREVISEWMIYQAKYILPKAATKFNRVYNPEKVKFKVSNALKRWGSCSNRGSINLSWRLVMAPPEIIEYVIAHEIAHLAEFNHSEKFWRLVEKINPEYKRHKKWLKENGHLLQL